MGHFSNVSSFLTLVTVMVCTGAPQSQSKQVPMLKGPYGPTLADCKANWEAYSDDSKRIAKCLESFLYASVIQLMSPDGMPAIGLDNMTPLKLPVLEGHDFPLFRVDYKNVEVHDFINYLAPEYCTVVHDQVTKISTVTTKIVSGHFVGDFDVKVKIGNVLEGLSGLGDLSVTGRGPVKYSNALSVVKIHWKKRKVGGLAVVKVESKTEFGDVSFNPVLTNPLGKLVEPLIKPFYHMQEITQLAAKITITPVVDREVARIVGTVLHRGWPRLEQLK